MLKSILKRVKGRLFLHLRYFLCFRGVSIKSAMNLYLSSVVDVLLHAISGWEDNPKCLSSGLYLVKPHKFYVYIRGGTDDLYHCLFRREEYVEDLIIHNLEEGDTFIDVGANVGYYTLLSSKLVGPEGRVVSIEPVPETFKTLLKNIKINRASNIIAAPKAAWNYSTKLKIYIPRKCYGFASVVRGSLKDEVNIVDAIPLDDILKGYTKIKLIKIDVEGAELQVLEGARKTLKKARYVILEVSREEDRIIRLLKEEGFKIHKLKPATLFAVRKD